MPGKNGATTRSPELLAANRPIARAIKLARGASSQEKFAADLRAAGVPARDHSQISGWELGADPDAVSDLRSIAVVPAWALVGAAKLARLSVSELLTMAGIQDQEPLIRQVAELRRRQEMLWERVNQILSDAGLENLPEIEEATSD